MRLYKYLRTWVLQQGEARELVDEPIEVLVPDVEYLCVGLLYVY